MIQLNNHPHTSTSWSYRTLQESSHDQFHIMATLTRLMCYSFSPGDPISLPVPLVSVFKLSYLDVHWQDAVAECRELSPQGIVLLSVTAQCQTLFHPEESWPVLTTSHMAGVADIFCKIFICRYDVSLITGIITAVLDHNHPPTHKPHIFISEQNDKM